MKEIDGDIHLSASDLVGHLNCSHLTSLNIQVAAGILEIPDSYNPLLEILRERGSRHETSFREYLQGKGFETTIIDGVDINSTFVDQTVNAMKAGKDIIIQGALQSGRWGGRADILRKIDVPSELGDWSYDVIDTKLARETKGSSILQLCLYADLLENVQGLSPEYIYIVAPWSDYVPQHFRFADYAAYFRRIKRMTEVAVYSNEDNSTYPDPKLFCDICQWRNQWDQRRRDDDHLCLVADITKNQIEVLQSNDVLTTQQLSELPSPIPFKPQKGSPSTYEKIKAQASIQVEARNSGELKHEILEIVHGTGLSALPEPSKGDIFFDIEGDPFVGEHGLEYLFGYAYLDEKQQLIYQCQWALNRLEEKKIFEDFIDFATERRKVYPDLHIYHFAQYEPTALKRLMGRYATRENEVDNLLRGLVFVDLHSVTRNAIRASVESYSLKKLEPFYNFERSTTLHDANVALTVVSTELELNDAPSLEDEQKSIVESYNSDDCKSTAALREWLENIRSQIIEQGENISRPVPGQEAPSEELDEQAKRIQILVERLINEIPIDPEERNKELQARWILAHILDWHRRENKAVWWEYFRLADLTADELIGEKASISGLTLIDVVDQTKTGIPTHRYAFEQQDTDLRGDEDLHNIGGDKIGKAISVSTENRTIDIKKTKATSGIHPPAVFAHTVFNAKEQAESLFRIGEYVAENGIEGDGPYKSARSLLLRNPLDIGDETFKKDTENTLEAALRLTTVLGGGVFPIQGPPGTGKSYTGARMICKLVKQGKKVGITANSHKVIRNLIDKIIEAAEDFDIDVRCIQKPASGHSEDDSDHLFFAKNNDEVISSLANGNAHVAGATHFFWSREDAQNSVDVLVVDEAGQMSLANALAISPAAETVILIGDPQQLEQPMQGSHPDGTGVSALDHLLDGKQTISEDEGLFLETSWRLHPDICAFNSELFYDSKLHPVLGCEQQIISSTSAITGSGLRYLPIQHTGNTSSSIEEADAVKQLVDLILSSNSTWTDRDGINSPITLEDILIIAPYNAQVFEIQHRLPNARVGTVDKFQGQEAPISIFSMATSSHADAPREMEFLYSANRFNVATSRAKCLSILVASQDVFEADCKTPRQMQLANAFCRYLEMAQSL